MKPYYDQDGITIYHGDCREVLPTVSPETVDLLLTDPPFGIGYRDRTGRKIAGDAPGEFGKDDVLRLLEYSRCIIWGAENFHQWLPPSRGWIVWAKVQDQKLADVKASVSNVELAWSNVAQSPQLFNHYWRDWIRRASERGVRYHPALKPVELMVWLVDRYTGSGETVLDPYMGSGPVVKACHLTGRRYIGIEIEEKYCEIAVQRLAQGVLPLGEEPQ